MNFTGLGIGNRHGVHMQLLGCCVAVAGMIFAFYVKPIIKRQRALQSRIRSSPADGQERLLDSKLDQTSERVIVEMGSE